MSRSKPRLLARWGGWFNTCCLLVGVLSFLIIVVGVWTENAPAWWMLIPAGLIAWCLWDVFRSPTRTAPDDEGVVLEDVDPDNRTYADHVTSAQAPIRVSNAPTRRGQAVAVAGAIAQGSHANAQATLALADQQRAANDLKRIELLTQLGAIGGGPITGDNPQLVTNYLRREYPEVAAALRITAPTSEEEA